MTYSHKSYSRVAAKVAQHKTKHPELYCSASKCLYRTGGGNCPRHTTVNLAMGVDSMSSQRKQAHQSLDLRREDLMDEAREVMAEMEERGDID